MIVKSYTQRKREEYKRFIYSMAYKWAWSGNVTKFVILHPLKFLPRDARSASAVLLS